MRKISKLCWILSICILPMLLISCGHQHKYSKEVIDPTCTKEGYTLYFCEECGDYYEGDKKEPLGHDIVQHDGKAATCEESGYKAYVTCKRCTYTTYCSIPALNHSYGEATYSWNQDNTKVTASITCGNDEKHIVTEIVDVEKEVISAQCKATGLITYIAKFESELFSTQTKEEVLPELGHDLKIEVAKNPTCIEAGYYAYEYCSRCDYNTKEDIPVLGHNYNSDEVCMRCGDLAAWEYLTYEYNNELQGYAVTGVAKERTTINIPKVYNGFPVKEIAASAFLDQENITRLNIPDSIVSIGDSAFKNCKRLREMVIPTSVQQRGEAILSGCSNLESLTTPHLPSALSGSIGLWFSRNSFENSYQVEYGYIPKSLRTVTYIGGRLFTTFQNCTYIEKIILKEVTSITKIIGIDEGVFKGCTNLKEIWFDSSMKKFDDAGLKTCNNLYGIYFKGDINDWANIDFNGYQPVQYAQNIFFVNALNQAERVRDIHITDSTIQEIRTKQFANFNDVENITFNSSITKIGRQAFSDCTSLQEINIPKTISTIQDGAFAGCINVKSIAIDIHPSTSINSSIIELFFGNTEYINSYKVGPTANAGYCPNGLEKITINRDTTLLRYEFQNMQFLKEIWLQDVSVISSYCFQNCYNLTTVVLKNITRIGNNAFANTTNLTNVYYEGTQESWSNVIIGTDNIMLTDSVLYFYSEEAPIEVGNYWHYVEGVPTLW